MRMNTTDFLTSLRCMMKLYDGMLKAVCEQYQLTLTEARIISFLYNNPGKDTAGDIVELKMLSKGNVSRAVDTLIGKSMLQRRQDEQDRRKIHLTLLAGAAPVTETIEKLRTEFDQELFSGASDEDLKLFLRLHTRLKENAQLSMKRRHIL